MSKGRDFVRQRIIHTLSHNWLPHGHFFQSLVPWSEYLLTHPGELTTSRKLGWQQTLTEVPRQLFSPYSITSWQTGCITQIGIAPSTWSHGDHRGMAQFSYHLGSSKDFKQTQESFLRNPSALSMLHLWKAGSILDPRHPHMQINHGQRRVCLLKLWWQSLVRIFKPQSPSWGLSLRKILSNWWPVPERREEMVALIL